MNLVFSVKNSSSPFIFILNPETSYTQPKTQKPNPKNLKFILFSAEEITNPNKLVFQVDKIICYIV